MSRALSSRQVASKVAAREGFNAGGLAGTPSRVQATGDLPQGLAERYVQIAPQVTYTITSFGTPIAWLTGRSTWTVPVVDVPSTHAAVVDRLVGA